MTAFLRRSTRVCCPAAQCYTVNSISMSDEYLRPNRKGSYHNALGIALCPLGLLGVESRYENLRLGWSFSRSATLFSSLKGQHVCFFAPYTQGYHLRLEPIMVVISTLCSCLYSGACGEDSLTNAGILDGNFPFRTKLSSKGCCYPS